MTNAPWFSYPFLLFPKRILRNLELRRELGLTDRPPNAWQLSLGVMRMWHRNLFRSETVGTSPAGTVRQNWRARLMQYRPLRFPFLLAERAIAPFDLTGLASSDERIIKHLLGAHHDGDQFIFDLELLSAHDGALKELRRRAREIVEGDDERSRWLRDLVVFENYHENLLEATEAALVHGVHLSDKNRWNADMSLAGYLSWCAQQPPTPDETLKAMREGTFAFDSAPRRDGAATGVA